MNSDLYIQKDTNISNTNKFMSTHNNIKLEFNPSTPLYLLLQI